jgi:hypothetical protein
VNGELIDKQKRHPSLEIVVQAARNSSRLARVSARQIALSAIGPNYDIRTKLAGACANFPASLQSAVAPPCKR